MQFQAFTFRLIQHFKRVVLKTKGKILERQLEFQLGDLLVIEREPKSGWRFKRMGLSHNHCNWCWDQWDVNLRRWKQESGDSHQSGSHTSSLSCPRPSHPFTDARCWWFLHRPMRFAQERRDMPSLACAYVSFDPSALIPPSCCQSGSFPWSVLHKCKQSVFKLPADRLLMTAR